MNDKARSAFEREYEAHCSPAEADWFRREEDDPEEYYHATTADAWWGFRAALQWAASQQAAENGDTLYLWKDGDRFLAFKHLYPCYSPGGDPMTLGEPCARAEFRASHDRAAAPAAQGERDEQ